MNVLLYIQTVDETQLITEVIDVDDPYDRDAVKRIVEDRMQSILVLLERDRTELIYGLRWLERRPEE